MSSRVSGVVSVINVLGTPLSNSVEVIFTPGVVSVINVGTPLIDSAEVKTPESSP
jgi:hypothetical protein